ncbi:hypothetical protein DPMN_037904 [Dreissena polymorpha]|uniref:Uncharacterized protein n=1 Tax=Dreissena polymorpha TaxID=45954 RepID=A0A9D4MDD8_DREPO|nr:hypothetical protein DPMN_037904 [Dreissena polymorpha]
MDLVEKVLDTATECYETTKDGIVTCMEKIQSTSRNVFESFLNFASYASSGLEDAKLFGNVNKEKKHADNSNGTMLTKTSQTTRYKQRKLDTCIPRDELLPILGTSSNDSGMYTAASVQISSLKHSKFNKFNINAETSYNKTTVKICTGQEAPKMDDSSVSNAIRSSSFIPVKAIPQNISSSSIPSAERSYKGVPHSPSPSTFSTGSTATGRRQPPSGLDACALVGYDPTTILTHYAKSPIERTTSVDKPHLRRLKRILANSGSTVAIAAYWKLKAVAKRRH